MKHDDEFGHDHTHGSKAKWVLIGFFAIMGFFLFTEHRAHLYNVVPYLLVLACPLMHMFMHGGHGGHRHHGHGGNDQQRAQANHGKNSDEGSGQ